VILIGLFMAHDLRPSRECTASDAAGLSSMPGARWHTAPENPITVARQGAKVRQTIDQMIRMVELFSGRCSGVTTLNELKNIVGNRDKWPEAKDLFHRIRDKTLAAGRAKNRELMIQYYFEEICAKSLYNFSGQPAPFDADAAYWIIRDALSLARALHIGTEVILDIIGVK
jgi:hypothetical protein